MFGENDNVDFPVSAAPAAPAVVDPPAHAVVQHAERKQSKSERIRNFHAANPSATSAQIVTGLGLVGIAVRKQLVDNVLWYDRTKADKKAAKKGTKKAAKKAAVKKLPPQAQPVKASARELTVTELLRFKTLIEQIGGIAVVKAAIAALERLSK